MAYMVFAVLFNFYFVSSIDGPIILPPDQSATVSGKHTKSDQSTHAEIGITTSSVGRTAVLIAVLVIMAQIATFLFFAPVTYGNISMSADQMNARKWLSSWEFHFTK